MTLNISNFENKPFIDPFCNLYKKGSPNLDKLTSAAARSLDQFQSKTLNHALSIIQFREIRDGQKVDSEYQKMIAPIAADPELSKQIASFLAFRKPSKKEDSAKESAKELANCELVQTLKKNYPGLKLDLEKLHLACFNLKINQNIYSLTKAPNAKDLITKENKIDAERLLTGIHYLSRARSFLQLNIEEKERYYSTTSIGKLAKRIQDLKEKLGFKSTLTKSNEMLKRYNYELDCLLVDSIEKTSGRISKETFNLLKTKLDDSNLKKSTMDIVNIHRRFAIQHNKKTCVKLYAESNPLGRDQMIFASPNGDVYVIELSRRINKTDQPIAFEGMLYRLNQFPKAFTILGKDLVKEKMPHVESSFISSQLKKSFGLVVSQINKPGVFIFGEKQNDPSDLFFRAQNGDIYHLDRTQPPMANGAGRLLFKATYLSPSGETTNKKVAILTTLPPKDLKKLDPKTINATTRAFENEQKILKNLAQVNGVIKFDQFFKKKIGNFHVAFAAMPLYEMGDLDHFLTENPNLDASEKENFMASALETLAAIHKKNQLHLDIKEKNLLVDIDPKTKALKPIFIDFECSADIRAPERGTEDISTIEYWPPEYIDAYNKAYSATNKEEKVLFKQRLISAKNTKMDIWALGLIFYRLQYGNSFIKALDSDYDPNNMSETGKRYYLSQLYKKNIDQAFPKGINSEIDQLIYSMLAIDPNERPDVETLLKAFK